ncbi:type IX secretion system protein PorQ [Polaribacter haliotis]|uniref:Type IX secretion system protein PorQ n=1 Tax=Polaribacter haliotis TaxID=1888915 RepID=A0A7L8AG21_9FLAO|nr:type IX secretion system protein PorQ [Polaribacter haliotis]QOD60900.1 type IX secretion system protein PorQ [Polaribacter haliotis]
MKFIHFLFFFFLFLCTTNAQVGGENIYQFLNISSSARQIALGGEVLTLLDDVNQPIWNPATINSELDNKLSANYSSFLAGISVGSISYARDISRRFGTIQGSIKYLDYGSLIEADEQGIETGTFNASDLAISVGYSYNFPNTNFFLGANIKFINSNISSYSSIGIAGDLGILYYSPYKSFSFTLVARNIGTQIKSFNGQIEKLPFVLALGGSYKLEYVPLKWYGTINNLQHWNISTANPSDQTTDLEGNVTEGNVSFFGNAIRHLVIGAELFPESLINLRFGYNFRRSAELKLQNVRTFSGISVGFGVKMNRFKLNYAYSKYHSVANASTFSLEIDLNSQRR